MTPFAYAGCAPDRARIGLVMVHGRGAGAADILSLLPFLGLADVAGVAPEAKDRSWWPTSFLAPMSQMAAALADGIAALEGAIAAFQAAGLPRNRIALMGFSQGACLALEFTARHGAGLHSVTGFSGGLIGTADAGTQPDPTLYHHMPKRFDYTSPLPGLPVHITCHERDPHIPLARVRESVVALDRLGAVVSSRILPGPGHGFGDPDMAGLRQRLS